MTRWALLACLATAALAACATPAGQRADAADTAPPAGTTATAATPRAAARQAPAARTDEPVVPLAQRPLAARLDAGGRRALAGDAPGPARNAILFVGDGMGVSTVTATRVFGPGVDGQLAIDQLPFTALSRTATTDYITADSAGTMTAMMTGVNTNSGILGFGPDTEPGDFAGDGDGEPLVTLLELARGAGRRVGIVTTTRVTHATPAACFAKLNDRDREDDVPLQALPGEAHYNAALGDGIDLLLGGGRRHFVPREVLDEEGDPGHRRDGRDLRAEFASAGYRYVWNDAQLAAVGAGDLPLLGLFESSHMAFEHDRPRDAGGEPSLEEMTRTAIRLLDAAAGAAGWLLVVEGGRIDHAHHAGNAWRALHDTLAFDAAVGAALESVDLQETLVLVTADHSHVFHVAGYPLRPLGELPYAPSSTPPGYAAGGEHAGLMGLVHTLAGRGAVVPALDAHGVPYTVLGYLNGPGARDGGRVDPRVDTHPGADGAPPDGPADPDYRQEAHVPLGAETHGADDVVLYGIGPGAHRVRGTLPNTAVFEIMRAALGL